MNNIPAQIKILKQKLQAHMEKDHGRLAWARISIVLTDDGFYPMINGNAIEPRGNDTRTVEEAMDVIEREVDRICLSGDLLANTLGIEVAA